MTVSKYRLGSMGLGQTGSGRLPDQQIESCRVGWTMRTVEPGPAIDLSSISRAVASVAVGVVHTIERAVVGDAGGRIARDNAWAAVCADRARARRREEIRRMVAALTDAETTPPGSPATDAGPASPVRVEPAGRPGQPDPIGPALDEPRRAA
ncbi:hypothetical protein GCM10027290_16420 [Micromonospora sonneratiae]